MGRRLPVVFGPTAPRPARPAPTSGRRAAVPLAVVVVAAVLLTPAAASAAWSGTTGTDATFTAATLATPTNVQAQTGCYSGARGVKVSWTPQSPVTTQFEVQRSVTDAFGDLGWVTIGQTAGTSIVDAPAVGLASRYRVRAVIHSWVTSWSATSNVVTLTIGLPC